MDVYEGYRPHGLVSVVFTIVYLKPKHEHLLKLLISRFLILSIVFFTAF